MIHAYCAPGGTDFAAIVRFQGEHHFFVDSRFQRYLRVLPASSPLQVVCFCRS